MPPRWFNSAKFGRDCTNIPSENQDIINDFKETFLKKLDDFTFSSTGPIIEEVTSEDEREAIEDNIAGISYEKEVTLEDEQEAIEDEISRISHEKEVTLEDEQEVIDDNISRISREKEVISEDEQENINENIAEISHENIVDNCEVSWPDPPTPPPTSSRVTPIRTSLRFTPIQAPPRVTPIELSREGIGLRRSQRQRRKPLDFARGERVVYDINKCIVGYEQGFPEKYSYGRKVKTSKTSKSRPIPSGCTQIGPVVFKVAKRGGYRFLCTQIGRRIDGVILLGPKKSKPEARTTPNQHYGFFVTKGQILLKISNSKGKETIYIDDNHGFWTYLPPGSRYTLKNFGSSEAMIAYGVEESPMD